MRLESKRENKADLNTEQKSRKPEPKLKHNQQYARVLSRQKKEKNAGEIMRRHRAVKRQVVPDVKYNSELVARMINTIMLCGKKAVSQKIVYDAFAAIKKKKKDMDPLDVFLQAVENVKPKLEVKSRRVGGATYQIPVEIEPERQTAIAMRWIRDFSASKKKMSMRDALALEILDAFDNTGASIKKRDDTHKMAQANKAFAHYKW
jgi:small subunit ribosomal protein S7